MTEVIEISLQVTQEVNSIFNIMYIEKSVRCQAKSTSSVIKDLNYNTSDMPIKPVIKVYSPKKH